MHQKSLRGDYVNHDANDGLREFVAAAVAGRGEMMDAGYFVDREL